KKETKRRHDRPRRDIARTVKMQVMPHRIRLTRADVRQVRPGAHAAEQNRLVVNVIARHGASRKFVIAPAAREIRAHLLVAHLLAVTRDAALGDVNLPALRGLTAGVDRINVARVFIDEWLQIADLKLRHHCEPDERQREGGEDSAENHRELFHTWSPPSS